MAVPNFSEDLMVPVLRSLQDGQPRSMKEIREAVAAEVGVSEADRSQTIQSGMPVVNNRVAWSLTYLAQAGLVLLPRRAVHQISERGLAVLREHPDRIANRLLLQFEEFKEFKEFIERASASHNSFRVDVLILDDFALKPLDPTQTNDFYELIVERHRRASTIVTSNREPAEWLTMMSDALLAQSAVDRLTSGAPPSSSKARPTTTTPTARRP